MIEDNVALALSIRDDIIFRLKSTVLPLPA